MLRCREVHVQRKIVSREPHIISKVPRPFGELTHPSWRAEEVAFVVLVAIASPRYKVKMKKRGAIAPCAAHCLGIIACSRLHLLTLPRLAGWIRVPKACVHRLGAFTIEPWIFIFEAQARLSKAVTMYGVGVGDVRRINCVAGFPL